MKLEISKEFGLIRHGIYLQFLSRSVNSWMYFNVEENTLEYYGTLHPNRTLEDEERAELLAFMLLNGVR